MDFSEECNAQSICFNPPLPRFSASNELAGFDGKLWFGGGGGGGGGGEEVTAMMKVSWFLISKCWQVCIMCYLESQGHTSVYTLQVYSYREL